MLIALACWGPAYALDWRLEPHVRASTTYTDNASQSATNPQDAMILSVTPGFNLRSHGSRRVEATLQYSATAVARFGDDKESDNLHHNLNAAGKAELIEDFLFVDGSARISQELISLLGSPADAEINDSNRATVGTYSVSPYIKKRLGTFAQAEARYTASGAIFENEVATNSASNVFSAGLSSGTRFDDVSWGLNYSIRKTDNEDTADTTFERLSATAGYALTRKFKVFGTVGEEWNEYLSLTKKDGSFYNAGFDWSPSRRTSVVLSAGERFLGQTYGASARHRTRTSRWSLSYAEDISDMSRLLFEEKTAYAYLCPEATGDSPFVYSFFLIPPAPGCVLIGEVTGKLPSIASGVFISKILRAGVNWGTGKITYSFNVFDTRRDYQLLNSEDRSSGAIGSVNYRIQPKTRVNASLGVTRNEVPAALSGGTDREDSLYTVTLGLNRQFAARLSGALTLRRTQRDSNAANSDYEENSLTASVNMRF